MRRSSSSAVFLQFIDTGLQGEEILLHLMNLLFESINYPGLRLPLHIFRRNVIREAVDVARVRGAQPCVHALNNVCCVACEVPRSASVAEG
eukprot:7382384-Prymnesium_polylepis.1